jgi:hypothetical protein
MISLSPSISVYEPGQKAILAWNGEKEVMILSTNVKGTGNSKVLEIVPFYNKPEIEEANFDSFHFLENLFTIHTDAPGSYNEPGLTIVAHETIGPHDLTTIFVDFSEEASLKEDIEKRKTYEDKFEAFVLPYLKSIGFNTVTFPDNLGKILKHYSSNGRWSFYCVLDVIDVSSEEKSVVPLAYTFETYKLYYPLVISQLTPGETNIQLYVIMEGILDIFLESIYYPSSIYPFQLGHMNDAPYNTPMIKYLDKSQLEQIDPRVAELFLESKELILVTAIEFSGNTDELRDDFEANYVLRHFEIKPEWSK